jgi:hypothetical protein
MIVFDREGNFLRSWGEDIFTDAHGLHMAPDDTIFYTDDGDHTVRRCTLAGNVLMTIGAGKARPLHERPAVLSLHPHGAVTERGNLRVGRLRQWLRPQIHTRREAHLVLGQMPLRRGEFNLPHNIHCDADGGVYVADREKHRIQVLDGNGRYETQWNNLHRLSAFHMTTGKCPICLVGEIGPYLGANRGFPNLGPRISILDRNGKLLSRLGLGDRAFGQEPDQFMSPHGIAPDSRGDIYVGEVSFAAWPSLYPGVPRPDVIRCLQKLVRLGPDESGGYARRRSGFTHSATTRRLREISHGRRYKRGVRTVEPSNRQSAYFLAVA